MFMCDGDDVVEGVWMVELGVLARDINEMSVCRDDLCELKICWRCLSGIECRWGWDRVLLSEMQLMEMVVLCFKEGGWRCWECVGELRCVGEGIVESLSCIRSRWRWKWVLGSQDQLTVR